MLGAFQSVGRWLAGRLNSSKSGLYVPQTTWVPLAALRKVLGSFGWFGVPRGLLAAGQLRAMNSCQEKLSKNGRACSGVETPDGMLMVSGRLPLKTGLGGCGGASAVWA